MKRKKSQWLILTGTFLRLVGVDYKFIKQSGEAGIARFYAAGLALFGIILVSIFSIYYAFEMMFRKWQVEVMISVFFSGLFLLIYILLIQTFSKSVLSNVKTSFTLTNVLRVGYILFMGFIISKPLEAYFFRTELTRELTEYKIQLSTEFSEKVHQLYNSGSDDDVAKIENEQSIAVFRIEHSDFFIKRLQLLVSKHPESWIICLLVIILFFLPGFLIYTISGKNEYYLSKQRYEKELILADYGEFKTVYAELFLRKYNLEGISYYENYLDPPFNTIRKPEQHYLSNKEFVDKILYSK